jgi:hypothetical protein
MRRASKVDRIIVTRVSQPFLEPQLKSSMELSLETILELSNIQRDQQKLKCWIGGGYGRKEI